MRVIYLVPLVALLGLIVVGVLLVVFVVAAPEGVLGFFKRWLRS